MDGVIGLSLGNADAFGDLAAIVRFNAAGMLDARDGASYRALSAIPYAAGQTYAFELDVNVPTKSYSASVTPSGGSAIELARNFAFRSEQSALTRLGNVGQFVDSSAGSVEVCDFSATPLSTCQRVTAGDGFLQSSFQQQMGSFTVDFDATPSSNNMDGLVGLQTRGAPSFSSLAAIVRFNPDGFIDVRNGDVYAADVVAPYSAGQSHHVRMSVNLLERRYSVWVTPQGGAESAVATDFQFRTEQVSVTALDVATRVVDSATGYLDVCGYRVTTPPGQLQYLTTLTGHLGLESTGRLILSERGRSQTLDSRGDLAADVPYGGMIVVEPDDSRVVAGDFSGSIFLGGEELGSAGGNDIYLARYSTDWNHVWSRRLGTPGDDAVGELAGDGHGNVALTGSGIGTLKVGADGQTLWTSPLAPDDIAMDADGNLIMIGDFEAAITIGPATHTVDRRGIYLAKFDPAGDYVWSRAFAARDRPDPASGRPGTGSQDAHHVAVDPSGNIFCSGTFSGVIGFGGPELYYPGSSGESPSTMGFLIKLDASGSYVHELTHWFEFPADLAADAAGNVALTGRKFNPMPFLDLLVVRPTGELALFLNGPNQIGNGRGFPSDVVLDASGFVYWTGSAERSTPEGSSPFPFVARYSF